MTNLNGIIDTDEFDLFGDDYATHHGDCVPGMRLIAPESIDLAVFSPPFSSLFAYTDNVADMGNSRESDAEFEAHFSFFGATIAPLMKPGRNVVIHLQQVSRFKNQHGYIGLYDIRGRVIQIMERAGLHFYGESTISKCPQAQAIRTKTACLQFFQKARDCSVLRPALADYLLIFKAPGGNDAAILGDVSNEEWIEWARPIWREDPRSSLDALPGLRDMVTEYYEKGAILPTMYGIKETDTLNTQAAKSPGDERHVCPLQLPLIERVVRLWSNTGDVVLSPFMGVGSEGVISLRHHRRFIGLELNPRYYGVAQKNLRVELSARDAQTSLFDLVSK
ncbi:MAG: DNA methyltransferase [Myxococcota bacterium]